MAKRRIKVIWGGAEEIPGEWKLGVWGQYERDPGSRIKGLALSVRGLLRLVGWCVLGCYVAGAVALYAWFANQPRNRVTLLDTMLLPVRWAQVRELRGQMMIERGLDDLKAQRWAEAAMRLSAGLAKAPHNPAARLELAQFLVMANRRPEALKVLTADMANGYPGRTYLAKLFEIAREGEDFDLIAEVCGRFATSGPADAAWRLGQHLQALLQAGRAEEAVQMIDAKGEVIDAALREVRTLALLEMNRATEAVAYLEKWRRAPGANPSQVARLQVRAYREAGDLAAMDQALEDFRRMAPADPRTYAYGIVQQTLAGQTDAANAAMDEFFLRFAGNRENLQLLATALAEARAPALVQRCREVAATHGFPLLALDHAWLQAQLATGDWRGAEETVGRLARETDESHAMEKYVLEWLTALVTAAAYPDDGPQAVLIGFLQQRPVSMRIYRVTGETLIRAQRFTTAQRVLALSERAYAGSRTLAALKRQVEAGREVKSAVADAPEPVTTGVREKAFFAMLATTETDEQWASSAQAIREVLVSRPAWLERRESEVREWQMRVAARNEDIPELLQAMSAFLDGSTGRALKAFELARQLDAKHRREDAERVLREILRKTPAFPAATRLLEQWRQSRAQP